MEWEWLKEFGKGMIRPLLGLSVVVIGLVMSHHLKLGLVGETSWSILRGSIQLCAMGFVIQFLFTQQNSIWILGFYLIMVGTAAYATGQRAKHVPRGKYVAGVSILAGSSVPLLMVVMLNVVSFKPRYIIPIAGLLVGNSMKATGVTLKSLRDDIKMQKALVETALALGATTSQATTQQVKRSLTIAISPLLDSTKTVGLVMFPGTMIGMMLAGTSPEEAIRIQLVIKCMVIGAVTVSSITSVYLSRPSFFTESYQLKTDIFGSD
ncbi:OLC1v1034706C1 [Oldenlandia corymbosa var. corymbosa]|uniref:OLC1v1034706C1 n=1 Tax=Oldenlandia corymbosa var. corymbosa TaxID=529605 RepID=A0AAV1CRY5_OLDCO|nr:OLC1v1034706C1 [Oldenlandia corymbosa var. corymbosa]